MDPDPQHGMEQSDARRAFHAWLEEGRSGNVSRLDDIRGSLPEPARLEFDRIMEDYKALSEFLEPARARIASGRSFGEYRLIQEIGRGGMGVVWEAYQTTLRRNVALKLLYPHLSWSARPLERFQREAAASARLTHPAVVTVYETGEQDGFHYIAQELVPGGLTLADEIADLREAGRLPPRYFLAVAERFAALADALGEAHRLGVIHRDVKPGNVLIDPQGRAKLADFGLALVIDEGSISRTGDVSGTPYYMSPEQAAGRRLEVDHRTDIFSLGATLYEALTLERPFRGDSIPEVMEQILLEDPVHPRRIRRGVPRDLEVVCLRCLEKRPDRRYLTMGELADDLRRFLAHEPIRARPPGAWGRFVRWTRRHPVMAVGGTVTVVALVAVSISLAVALSALRFRELALELVVRQTARDDRRRGDSLTKKIEDAGAMRDLALQDDHPLTACAMLTNAGRSFAELGSMRDSLDCLRRARQIAHGLPEREFSQKMQTLAELVLVCEDMDLLDEVHDASAEGFELVGLHPADRKARQDRRFFRNHLYLVAVRKEDAQAERELTSSLGEIPHLMKQDLDPRGPMSTSAERVRALTDYAELELLLGHVEHAEALDNQLLVALRTWHGELDRSVLAARLHLATAISHQKGARSPEAEEMLRGVESDLEATVQPEDPLLYEAMWRLGANLIDQSRHDEAALWYEKARAGVERSYGAGHLDVLDLRTGLVMLAGELGQPSAEEDARSVLRDLRRWRPNHTSTLIAQRALCGVLMKIGKWQEAEQLALQSWHDLSETRGPFDRVTLEGLSFVVATLEHNGKINEAEEALYTQLDGQAHAGTDVAGAWLDLGFFHEKQSRPVEARDELSNGIAELHEQSTPSAWRMYSSLVSLGRCCTQCGDAPAARAALLEAKEWWPAACAEGHSEDLHTPLLEKLPRTGSPQPPK